MAISQLAIATEGTFARHETFHPRYGWLRKAVVSVGEDPSVFAQPDATVRLGVGKNMVRAIKFWGLAFKLLKYAPNLERPRLPLVRPTQLGRGMFSNEGWDPYVECPATLWVLHWWLLAPPCRVPVWWLGFNAFDAVQFTEASLVEFTSNTVDSTVGWPNVMYSSIKKDVDCLLRMYAPKRFAVEDDVVDSPFRELGLIESVVGSSRTYRFAMGPKYGLPDAALAYACLDFMARLGGASTITVARLAEDVGSPGRAFRLTEGDIYQRLVRFCRDLDSCETAEPAGVKQLLVNGSPGTVAQQVLDTYYEQARQSLDRTSAGATEEVVL